ENERLLDAADLLDNFFRRTPRLSVAEIRLDRAELATKVAAAACLDRSYGKVPLSREDGPVGTKTREGRAERLAVNPAQSAHCENRLRRTATVSRPPRSRSIRRTRSLPREPEWDEILPSPPGRRGGGTPRRFDRNASPCRFRRSSPPGRLARRKGSTRCGR